jgi:hypothetical protein
LIKILSLQSSAAENGRAVVIQENCLLVCVGGMSVSGGSGMLSWDKNATPANTRTPQSGSTSEHICQIPNWAGLILPGVQLLAGQTIFYSAEEAGTFSLFLDVPDEV